MPKPLNLVGERFDRLTVTLKNGNKKGRVFWECLCDPKYGGCGTIVFIAAGNLRNGRTRSCGCWRKEATIDNNKVFKTTHGKTHTEEYRIWGGIKSRCYDINFHRYQAYGAQGITMSDEWKNSFEAFYRDMGPRPSKDHSIDRRDNRKGYSKENCRWATRNEQANNRNNTLYYEFDGERKSLADWCREFNVDRKKLYKKLQKGMGFEDAVDELLQKKL